MYHTLCMLNLVIESSNQMAGSRIGRLFCNPTRLCNLETAVQQVLDLEHKVSQILSNNCTMCALHNVHYTV